MSKGKLIGFWTLRHRTGVTTLSILTALDMSNRTNANILLVDANFYSDMNKIVDLENKEEKVLDNLINLVHIGELNEKNLTANVLDISEKLHILPGTNISSMDYLRGKESQIMTIIQLALETYDVVIVDCNAGLNNMLTKTILDSTDVIVDILEQDGLMLNDFKDRFSDVKSSIFAGRDVVHVLNKHSKTIFPTLKEVEKLTGYEKILKTSYDDELRSAFNSFNLGKYYSTSNSDLAEDIHDLTKHMVSLESFKDLELVNAVRKSKLKGLSGLFRR